MSASEEMIHTQLWEEEPEQDNPFAAVSCYCAGYDVYGELLGKIGWVQYLYLLFAQELPTAGQANLLGDLAVALANPGPRDLSVQAAMSAGVGGSTHASCLMAALAVGAGQFGGAREVASAMKSWQICGQDIDLWRDHLSHPRVDELADVWPDVSHPAGFDPYGASCATPVRKTLALLARHGCGPVLEWLSVYRESLEAAAGAPLAMTGVAAAAMIDLGLTVGQGEMLFLFLRLPGAAVHALEQEENGYKKFPFFKDGLVLTDDPAHIITAMPGGRAT